jgi:hypothetical protein
MITDFSEPDGPYPFTVITSNEVSYQSILPRLTKSVPQGGAYFGVGPEQNFTYIAALRPRIAFLIDIRRDMMLEHLMYKAIFEASADRAEFVSRLFGKKRPSNLSAESPVDLIFRAFAAVPADQEFANATLKDILSRLKTTHGFPIRGDDAFRIEQIYRTFVREGVLTFRSSIESPGYTRLMTVTDGVGKNWSFLASTENYESVRAMHAKNLIVPLVGDFAGPKAVRMAAQYVRDHGAIVNVFYLSNVEDYLQPPLATDVARGRSLWTDYVKNVGTLPIDRSSVLIRLSLNMGAFDPWLASTAEFVQTGMIR